MRFGLTYLFLISLSSLFAQVNFIEIPGGAIFSSQKAHGVSIGDYDNDGDDDIFISASPSKLLRNNGDFSFTDVSNQSGINGSCQVAVWFDANNDGWLDLYTATWNLSTLYRNNGNGTFTALSTSTTGLNPSTNQALLAGDLNGDGWLDIYCNNFNRPNQLFINQGEFLFEDRISGSGAEISNLGMGGLLTDFDKDGDLDIYLVFDGGQNPNVMFQNTGNGRFQKLPDPMGLHVAANGMGVDAADFNHDGQNDFYVTNLYNNFCLMSRLNENYEDKAPLYDINDNGMGWGVVCFDYDNDTFADVYINNEFSYSAYTSKLYRNSGGTGFTEVSANTPLENNSKGYGAAVADLDSDGKQELIVVNFNSGIKIFRNSETGAGNWVELNLIGTTSNKFAVGARVEILADGDNQFDEITAGSGYATQNSTRLHFGLAQSTAIDQLSIYWPDGMVEHFNAIPANKRYLVIQGGGLSEFSDIEYKGALTNPGKLDSPIDVPGGEIPELTGKSIARLWNEIQLLNIRKDFARPTIQARNLFHVSAAMYDAWAVFDGSASPYFLGQPVGLMEIPYHGFSPIKPVSEARNEAISFAAFRIILHSYKNSPGAAQTIPDARKLFSVLGYDEGFTSTDYSTGSAAALGNYIASKIIEFRQIDGSNEEGFYENKYYEPLNNPIFPELPGSQSVIDPNRWQPITLIRFIDQNGNEISNTPEFLSPELGNVLPFALYDSKKIILTRDDDPYIVYHYPLDPPYLDKEKGTGGSNEYKWNFELVSVWSSHLSTADSVKIDISPTSIGNLNSYPTTLAEYHTFYDFFNGGDHSPGYSVNPKTGSPYVPQIVYRGDYVRVLAEYWADGPDSETPPGHWFTVLNYVIDHPLFEKKFSGNGEPQDLLEWDVKAYLVLGGALHDVAISAWGIKGYYDYVRPITAIRYLADRGQSSDPGKPRYHPAGIELKPGFIELVTAGDPLAGNDNEHVNKIKLYCWRGPSYISNPETEFGGVGWILAENWFPYQRPTFVTPPFAGYISGHSTYSSAAAEVLTLLTGDEYFPGGLGEFKASKNKYLVFEEGPSKDITLQWARYKDASDQCSLSRIWGGIHPPADDIPGRHMGKVIGYDAFHFALNYFNGTITAVSENNPVQFDVYPNPTSENKIVRIHLSETLLGSNLTLLDLYGREVRSLVITETQFDISLQGMAEGLYLLAIKNRNRLLTKKLIVR